MIIKNGANTPINANSGTLPNMTAALLNWFQQMTFGVVVKTISDFQVVETMTEVSFMGVWQPLTGRQLMMKPEGERQWDWYWLHADPSLTLKIDDIIIFLGVQYRVMTQKNYTLYGYVEYTLVNDYTGSGPTPTVPS